MSEEKKAIEILKSIIKVNKDFFNYEVQNINKKELLSLETLLNLIEKQQKEIKELKQENNFLKNQELGYIAGYEDGKKHKQTAVAIRNENMQYELYDRRIKLLQKELEELKEENTILREQITDILYKENE